MSTGGDARLEALLVRYLEGVDAGEPPDIAALCRDEPELAPALRELIAMTVPDGSAAADPLLGTRLGGRYRIDGQLGAGGMGLVYAAHDENLDREVAIKVLEDLFRGDPERVARFEREARSLAALQDPHIVAVHDVDFAGRPPFLVMDRIHGCDLAGLLQALREQVAAGQLPSAAVVGEVTAARLGVAREALGSIWSKPWPELVARLGVQASRALAAAHAAGVVHRDVKPSNLMLDATGALFLLDFGLARRALDPTLTRDASTVGTPLYMSPEQILGHEAGPPSDLYSLGTTLYECLCLAPPFTGEGHELQGRILHDEPVPPRQRRARLPRDLAAICLKAMAKAPAQRYRSAAELAEDLERFLSYEPVLAKPRILPAPLRVALSWWRRHRPPAAALIAAVVVVVLAVVGGSMFLGGRFAASERQRDERVARLVASLPPGVALAGTKEERLRDPRRPRVLAALAEIGELAPGDVEAPFLELALREEAGEAVAAPRRALVEHLGADRFARLWQAFTLLRDRPDEAKARQRVAQAAVDDLAPLAGAGGSLVMRLLLLAHAELGDAQRVAELARALEARGGPSALSEWGLGLALLLRGAETDETSAHLRRADELSPQDPPTVLALAKTLRRIGRAAEAESVLREMLRTAPEHVNYRHEQVLILESLGRYEEAETVLAGFPATARDLRDFERARILYRKALQETETQERDALLAQAAQGFAAVAERGASLERGLAAKVARALAEIEGLRGERRAPILLESLADAPLDATLLFNLGCELLRQPDTAELGRFHLRQVLALDPGHRPALLRLAGSYAGSDAEAGLRLLLRHLEPAGVTPAEQELLANLLRELLPAPARVWRERLTRAGLRGR